MSPPLVVTALIVAALVAALLGLNAASLRVYLRERRYKHTQKLGIAAWSLTVMGAFSGPFAPLLCTIGIFLAAIALRRSSAPVAGPKFAPVFPLPQDAWGEGGPELPARMAIVNGVGVWVISAIVAGGVYVAAQTA